MAALANIMLEAQEPGVVTLHKYVRAKKRVLLQVCREGTHALFSYHLAIPMGGLKQDKGKSFLRLVVPVRHVSSALKFRSNFLSSGLFASPVT